MRHYFALLLALLGGCAAQPMPDLAGPPGGVEYRTEGEPIDVTDALADALSLTDAVAEAILHDPGLQAALARLHLASADARQSRLLPNPVLSIVARFPEGGGSPTLEAGLTAELLALLSRPRQISAADHRLRAAGADVLTAALDVVAQTQEQFTAVQSTEAGLRTLERQQELVNRLATIARARVEAGESSRLDLLTLDAQRIGVESQVLETTARLRDQRLSLARLLGRPSDEAIWPLTPWTPPLEGPLDEAALIESALASRPEVQSRRWELSALGDEAGLARWWLNAAEVGIDAEREEGDWSVGPAVAIPLPIFDFGQARGQKATAAQVAARHELVRSGRQVVEEVRRGVAGVRSSRAALLKVRDELIPRLQRRHEQALAGYQAGEVDFTSVLLVEQELLAGRTRLVELEERAALAQVRLDRAVARPIEVVKKGSEP